MNTIKELLDKFDFSKWSEVMLYDEIKGSTSSKVKNAIKKHQIKSGEEILFLLDNSFWGSGKDSIIFTSKRLSICKSKIIGSNELYSFDWTEIKSCEILNGQLTIKSKIAFRQNKNIPLKDVLGGNHYHGDDFIHLVKSIVNLSPKEFTNQKRKSIPIVLGILGILISTGLLSIFTVKSDETYDQNSRPMLSNPTILLGEVKNVELSANLEPIYFALPEGDSLFIKADFNYPANIHLYRNKDDEELLIENNIKTLNKTIYIKNTDIYYLMIEADDGNYASIRVERKVVNNRNRDYQYTVGVDTIVKKSPFPGSKPSVRYDFKDVFKNPHKATVNSAGKKMLSGFGENRVVIPVQLPQKTSEWIYRLSLSYRDKATETTLHEDMNTTWNKINKTSAIATAFSSPISGGIMGRPIILQNQAYKMLAVGQAIDLATLLYDKLNEVPKEEAYINYFIITGEENAKKFLNGEKFDYSIKSSQRNIQSIEEIEKLITKGQIYIGLENTNIKEQVYAKLEVISIEQNNVHMKLERKLVRNSFSDIKKQETSQRKKCEELNKKLKEEQNKLSNIMEWQPLRTPEQKSNQIARQEKLINEIKRQLSYCN